MDMVKEREALIAELQELDVAMPRLRARRERLDGVAPIKYEDISLNCIWCGGKEPCRGCWG